jgi:hypothetical protein
MADAWLLELRRILRPGGRMFLSVHDRHLIDVLLTQFPDGWLTKVIRHFDAHARWLDTDFAVASVSTSPYAQIFYDIDYLRERWSAFLNVVAVHQQGHGVHTVVVLEKPAQA